MNKLQVGIFEKIIYIYLRAQKIQDLNYRDGFFKRKQENNFLITQTQCVMDDYNSLEQSIWSENLNNKSPYLLKALVDLHFC